MTVVILLLLLLGIPSLAGATTAPSFVNNTAIMDDTNVPDIGAYQATSGDLANTRATRIPNP